MVPDGWGREDAVAGAGWLMCGALILPRDGLETSLVELCRYWLRKEDASADGTLCLLLSASVYEQFTGVLTAVPCAVTVGQRDETASDILPSRTGRWVKHYG